MGLAFGFGFGILIVRAIEVVRMGEGRESVEVQGVFENRIERMGAFE